MIAIYQPLKGTMLKITFHLNGVSVLQMLRPLLG